MGVDAQPSNSEQAYIQELEDKNTALHAIIAEIREWAETGPISNDLCNEVIDIIEGREATT